MRPWTFFRSFSQKTRKVKKCADYMIIPMKKRSVGSVDDCNGLNKRGS